MGMKGTNDKTNKQITKRVSHGPVMIYRVLRTDIINLFLHLREQSIE